MTLTLGSADFFDTTAFALPPKVARMDAVRKLATRLTEVTGLGEAGAAMLAQAVVDPAAVRNALAEPLPGLTAHRDSHLQVIPARVWTPWVTPPADEVPRYGSKKRLPNSDPSIPKTPRAKESPDGITLTWGSPADRSWHLNDNENLYSSDIHTASLRLFPEKGGVATPLVLAPQTEFFDDGTDPLRLLRIGDGHRRYFEVQSYLRQFANLDEERLADHMGPDVTPEIFLAALQRDRSALGKVVNAVRDACTAAGDGNDFQQHLGVHYLATCLSIPAYIAVGTVDPVTSKIRHIGTDNTYPAGVLSTLEHSVERWHTGALARVVATGQRTYNGLQLPEGGVDTDLIDVAIKRLRARGVPKETIFFGQGPSDVRTAARFVWWCRAIRQLGGTPATACAAFALNTERHDAPWPQSISRSLLACATHVMEEDIDSVYPPGDYRAPETRPDCLSLLVADAKNLTAVAALSSDGHSGVLAHSRFRNAAHIALAHLAFIGALPAQEPLPERITGHAHLLSHVAIAWATTQTAVFVRPGGAVHHDADGRPVPIDERTLNRDDLPWPKDGERVGNYPSRYLTYLLPPSEKHPYEASHVFRLRHDVVYTIPLKSITQLDVQAHPESLAAVVRRWFPDATGIVLTDWSDKFITGIMVGSVYVRLFDRQAEREDARTRGVWYPDGRPQGTQDVIDFERADSEAPAGMLLGPEPWVLSDDIDGTVYMPDVEELMLNELDDEIIDEVDEALETQKALDAKGGNGQARRRPEARDIPVLRLPELKRARTR
ncbi:hypothetical protein ABZS76_32710 [Streptomyces sp. NPDC005562]|uniref:hypothetical protein n=1 Tax=Streptomyces sp. NPDC005562 TaxID=3154890 RepID=UPI00339ECFE4